MWNEPPVIPLEPPKRGWIHVDDEGYWALDDQGQPIYGPVQHVSTLHRWAIDRGVEIRIEDPH